MSGRWLPGVAAGLALLVACGGPEGDARSAGASAAITPASSGAANVAAASDDAWTSYRPSTPGGARPPCPADGHWSPCGVMLRLERAGVAPRVQPGPVREEPLHQEGRLVLVGSAELRLFIYPDSSARVADEQRLDPRRYIDASAAPTLRNEATLIRSDNLLAILRSRSETQRERVALAITAGPAQAKP